MKIGISYQYVVDVPDEGTLEWQNLVSHFMDLNGPGEGDCGTPQSAPDRHDLAHFMIELSHAIDMVDGVEMTDSNSWNIK